MYVTVNVNEKIAEVYFGFIQQISKNENKNHLHISHRRTQN